MENIFDTVFKNNGFAAMKVAPPTHKKTPEAIQNLIIFHHGNTTDEEINDVIQECKTMSDTSYEYSRLNLYFAVEHMLDEIDELKNRFFSFLNYSNTSEIFVGIFKNMEQYFEELKKLKVSTFNKNVVKAELEATITYVEGVLLLKAFAKNDNSLVPLISGYEKYRDELLETTKISQKALKVMKADYKVMSTKAIEKKAQSEMITSMKFNYGKLRQEKLERTMLILGDKTTYWYAVQDDKKWKDLYSTGVQNLSSVELNKLKEDLPVIFEQYKTLHYLSFTNMFKTILLAIQYYGESMSARNEVLPKNEYEYETAQHRRNEEIKEIEKSYSLYKKTVKEVQTPEITLENLEFASQIISRASNLQVELEKICNPNSSEHYLVLEKHNGYDVVKKTNSDLVIVLYKNEDHIYGCLTNIDELNSNTQPVEEAFKGNKGNSFISMSHFLKDIKDSFVQEYYFGKQEHVLNFIDKRN